MSNAYLAALTPPAFCDGIPDTVAGCDDPQLSFMEKLLSEVRFRELVKLITPGISNAREAFDILHPLLTQRRRVVWTELTQPGSSWRDTVASLDLFAKALHGMTDWTLESVQAVITNASMSAPRSLPDTELLYRCVLFSEFRLPLADSLWHLGLVECVARLEYVSRNLTDMNRIG